MIFQCFHEYNDAIANERQFNGYFRLFACSLVVVFFFLFETHKRRFYYDDANETPGPDITEGKSPRLQNKTK